MPRFLFSEILECNVSTLVRVNDLVAISGQGGPGPRGPPWIRPWTISSISGCFFYLIMIKGQDVYLGGDIFFQ